MNYDNNNFFKIIRSAYCFCLIFKRSMRTLRKWHPVISLCAILYVFSSAEHAYRISVCFFHAFSIYTCGVSKRETLMGHTSYVAVIIVVVRGRRRRMVIMIHGHVTSHVFIIPSQCMLTCVFETNKTGKKSSLFVLQYLYLINDFHFHSLPSFRAILPSVLQPTEDTLTVTACAPMWTGMHK